jgi:ribosome-associated translation inhibitor RaiA
MSRLDIVGLSDAAARRLRAAPRLRRTLAVLPARAVSGRLTFTDQNGPKGGPAVRCAVTLSLAGWGRLHVADQAETPGVALAGALDRLERRLQRQRAIEREQRRRPKKYYAARRAAAGDSGAVPSRRRRGGAVS